MEHHFTFTSHFLNHRIWISAYIVCSVIAAKAVIHRPLSSDLTTVVREGQRQYELIQEKSSLPDSGQCWKNAVAHLHEGCSRLTESLQVELALRFADCFMQSSGQPGIECMSNNRVGDIVSQQACLRNLTDRVFLTYTEFYTHSQSMCLFLMSQVWHQETQKTIDKLWSSASDVSKHLEEASKIQETLLDGQKESINLQQTLLDNSHQLGHLVHESTGTLATVFKEFRSTAAEQHQLLGQVFNHLSALQSWVVGEVSWLDSLVFYICTTFFAYLVTTPRRVSEARFLLFIVLLISASSERLLSSYILAATNDPESFVIINELKEQLYWWLWCLRKGSLAVCGFVVAIVFYKYTDPEKQRHQLLLQILSQNKEMISFLQNKLANQGLKNFHDTPDSIVYKAIKVNPATPSTPKMSNLTPHANNSSERSPSPRQFFDYAVGNVTPSMESVLSRLPTPPTNLPSAAALFEERLNTSIENTSLQPRAGSSDTPRRRSSLELRTSSNDETFYSVLKGESELSEESSVNKSTLKSRTKSPSRSRKKSPARKRAVNVRETPYNLRRHPTATL